MCVARCPSGSPSDAGICLGSTMIKKTIVKDEAERALQGMGMCEIAMLTCAHQLLLCSDFKVCTRAGS
eukprot:1160580-Pelagomonas_calceolata.AAC.4